MENRNKKLLFTVAGATGLLVVGGIAYLFSKSKQREKEQRKPAPTKKNYLKKDPSAELNIQTTSESLHKTAEKLKEEGNSLYKEGNFESAINRYSKAIKMNPKEFKYYNNRSIALIRLDRYTEALKDGEKMAEIVPENPKGHYTLGMCYMRTGRYRDGAEQFRITISLSPTNKIAKKHLSFCEEKLRSMEEEKSAENFAESIRKLDKEGSSPLWDEQNPNFDYEKKLEPFLQPSFNKKTEAKEEKVKNVEVYSAGEKRKMEISDVSSLEAEKDLKNEIGKQNEVKSKKLEIKSEKITKIEQKFSFIKLESKKAKKEEIKEGVKEEKEEENIKTNIEEDQTQSVIKNPKEKTEEDKTKLSSEEPKEDKKELLSPPKESFILQIPQKKVETKESDPIESKESNPIEPKESDPIESKESNPIEPKESDPIESKESVQIEPKESASFEENVEEEGGNEKRNIVKENAEKVGKTDELTPSEELYSCMHSEDQNVNDTEKIRESFEQKLERINEMNERKNLEKSGKNGRSRQSETGSIGRYSNLSLPSSSSSSESSTDSSTDDHSEK